MTETKQTTVPEGNVDKKTGTQEPALEQENPRLLAEHQPYMTPRRRVRGVSEVDVGDIAEFVYEAEPRTVFVLNPNFKMQLHGLSLKKMNHHALMVEIIDKMRPNDTPLEFYNRIIRKPSIAEIDAYRTYDVRKMSNIVIRRYKEHV